MVLSVSEAGRKGGKARLNKMTAKEREDVARSGGAARAANLTAKERTEAARLAANARWAKQDKGLGDNRAPLDRIEKRLKKMKKAKP